VSNGLLSSKRKAQWFAFMVLVVWLVGTRWIVRNEPFDRDISVYAVAGREIVAGRMLYSDIWDHKPPGIHLIFAGATVLVGPGMPAVLLTNALFSILVATGLIYAGSRVAGATGGVMGGLLWALVGGDLGLQANQPNVELPMNACVAWTLAVSLGWRRRLTSGAAWLTGALAACGLLLKLVIAAPIGLLAALDAGERWRQAGTPSSLGYVNRWLGGMTLGLMPVVMWCGIRAGVRPVWDALVIYNLNYPEGSPLGNLLGLTKINDHLPVGSLMVIGLLFLLFVAGLFHMDPQGRRRLLVVLAGSAVAIAAPGRFYPHYYQLFLPPLIVGAAAGLTHFLRNPGVVRLTAVSVLVVLLVAQIQSLRLPPDEWSRRKFGERFIRERQLADSLKARLDPGEFFWQFAHFPGFYLYTDTVPASGVIYDSPLFEKSPVKGRLVPRVISELAKNLPNTIVTRKSGGDRQVLEWIQQRYRLVKRKMPGARIQLWVLDDCAVPDSDGHDDNTEGRLNVDGFEDGSLDRWSRHSPEVAQETSTPSEP
jgi:hypothetical protein